MVGKIKWFDTVKGYGFITSSEVANDLFVHYRDVLQNGPVKLEPGDKVDFELGTYIKDGQEKECAKRVSRIQ